MTDRKLPPTMTYIPTGIDVGLDDKIPDHAMIRFAFDGQAIGFRIPLEELRLLSLRLFEAHKQLSLTKKPN